MATWGFLSGLSSDELSDLEERIASGRTVVYRGARVPHKGVLRGPAYFTNSETLAATYGPTTAYRLNLQRPYSVDADEWRERFTTSRLNPIDSVIAELDRQSQEEFDEARRYEQYEPEQSYDSVISTSTNNVAVVFVIDAEDVATEVDLEAEEAALPLATRAMPKHLRDKPVSQMTPEEIQLVMSIMARHR